MKTTEALPQAFILTGAFWAICRNSLYIKELIDRKLSILIMTPKVFQPSAEKAHADKRSPFSLISEIAYIEGSVDREGSFIPGTIAAFREWQQRYHIIGAFSVGETLVEPTGIFADAINIRSPGLRATRVCRSKYLQRLYLHKYSPITRMVPPGRRNETILEEMTYPMVIKPATRHSSSGVVNVENAQQAKIVLSDYPEHETLLLEQRVEGQEYSVETLSQNGKIIFSSVTHKVTTDIHTNNFVELAHTVPCKDLAETPLLSAAKDVLTILDFKDGVTHSEWRLGHDGKPYLMEIASRTPGDGILALYQLAYGKPLEPLILKIMLGEKTNYPKRKRFARQVYLEHQPGILKDVLLDWSGVEVQWISDNDILVWPDIPPGNVMDAPTLRAVFVHKKRGDRLNSLRASEDRSVSFFIDALTIEELDLLDAMVRKSITLEIENIHE